MMTLGQALADEFKMECVGTRKVLARVAKEHFGYRPHPKSMSAQALASHIVEALGFAEAVTGQDVLDWPTDSAPWLAADREELLARFDATVRRAEEAVRQTPDEKMPVLWTLSVGGQTIFQAPRAAVIRSFVINHMIHHRAQLGVYLRLLDVPVPQVYGPTADEAEMGGGVES